MEEEMMKKIIILLFITLFTAYGCTRVPNSVDTGVEAEEYNGENSNEITGENEILQADLDKSIKEIEKLKEENLNLQQYILKDQFGMFHQKNL
jgi:hypothetical protein